MTAKPRIVTPEEAQALVDLGFKPKTALQAEWERLAFTVATEPERTRAAVDAATEALAEAHAHDMNLIESMQDLICGEAGRTRAAVVKVLNEMIALRRGPFLGVEHVPVPWIEEKRDAIKNGADW